MHRDIIAGHEVAVAEAEAAEAADARGRQLGRCAGVCPEWTGSTGTPPKKCPDNDRPGSGTGW